MNKTIHLQVKEAKGFWEKGIGLINKKPTALLLRTRFGIHTFGMKYPIDVIILDKKHQIMTKKQHLSPNNIFVWHPKYNHVLELPVGSIEQHSMEIGDEITLSLR